MRFIKIAQDLLKSKRSALDNLQNKIEQIRGHVMIHEIDKIKKISSLYRKIDKVALEIDALEHYADYLQKQKE